MTTKAITIDSAGRLVVPKPLREEAGLRPGVELTIRLREGRLEIEPAPREVRLERRGRVLVAEAKEPGDELTRATVARTLDEVRHRATDD
jgi:AbrB family looped-hinge helix DNA binding protein